MARRGSATLPLHSGAPPRWQSAETRAGSVDLVQDDLRRLKRYQPDDQRSLVELEVAG